MPAETLDPPKIDASPTDLPTPQPRQGINNAFSDLDALIDPPASPPEPDASKVVPVPKVEAKPDPKTDSPPPTPAKDAKPEPKPEPAKPAKVEEPKTPKELRASYEAANKEVQRLRSEMDILKRQGATSDETKNLKAELEALRKQHAAAEETLKFTKFEASAEYRDKYEKPLEDALSNAYQDVSELVVEDDNGKRAGTPDDFNSILNLPLGQAADKAETLFGRASGAVLQLRSKILDLHRSRKQAIENFKTVAAQHAEKQKQQEQEHNTRLRARWEEASKTMVDRYPQWFGKDESDPEGNKLLDSGYALVDRAWDTTGQVPIEDQVAIRADLRHRAAGFGRLVQRNQKLEAQVRDLTEKLKGYMESTPGESRRDGSGAPAKSRTWEDDLNAAADVG